LRSRRRLGHPSLCENSTRSQPPDSMTVKVSSPAIEPSANLHPNRARAERGAAGGPECCNITAPQSGLSTSQQGVGNRDSRPTKTSSPSGQLLIPQAQRMIRFRSETAVRRAECQCQSPTNFQRLTVNRPATTTNQSPIKRRTITATPWPCTVTAAETGRGLVWANQHFTLRSGASKRHPTRRGQVASPVAPSKHFSSLPGPSVQLKRLGSRRTKFNFGSMYVHNNHTPDPVRRVGQGPLAEVAVVPRAVRLPRTLA